MTDEPSKDTPNQNPNNTGPAIVGRKNFMEDPTMQEPEKNSNSINVHNGHKELNIEEPSAENKIKQNGEAKLGSEVKKTNSESSGSVVDDSIVDPKIAPQPNTNIDKPAAKLIKDKTYRLPVHRGSNKTKLKTALMICFVLCVVMGSVYVLVF